MGAAMYGVTAGTPVQFDIDEVVNHCAAAIPAAPVIVLLCPSFQVKQIKRIHAQWTVQKRLVECCK